MAKANSLHLLLRSFTLRNFIEDSLRHWEMSDFLLRSFTLRNFIEDRETWNYAPPSPHCEALRFATSLRIHAERGRRQVPDIAKLYASQLH